MTAPRHATAQFGRHTYSSLNASTVHGRGAIASHTSTSHEDAPSPANASDRANIAAASAAPTPHTTNPTSSTSYYASWTVTAGHGGRLHCIQMDTSVNAANKDVASGADMGFDGDTKCRERWA
ncbi:hypothetical protein [Burkholderia cenocepacia]|uniref:hypothetical protein n=1 Tax=Burkholderia cenocepacia TaxID=95486 RepID=UPI00406D101C